MGCPFRDEVCLVADGEELEFTRRVIVEAHLGVCDACARVEEANDLVEVYLASGEPEPLGVIDAALAEPAAGSRRPFAAGIGLAAAAMVGVAMLLLSDEGAVVSAPRVSAPPVAGGDADADPVPPPAVPVRALLAERGPDEAARAVARAGASGSRELARLLRSRDDTEVESALAVARRAPSPWLVQSVAPLLERPRFAARAARLLGGIRSGEAVPALARALDGPAAIEAREALVAIGSPAAADVLAARAETDKGALDALVRIDAPRGARIVAGSRDDEVLLRRRARLLPYLRRMADDHHAGAVRALGRARDVESRDLLAELARRAPTRAAATTALLALRDERATEAAFLAVARSGAPAACFDEAGHAEAYLSEVYRDGSFAERKTALMLLGRCSGEAVLRIVEARTPRPGLMPTVIAALARRSDERAARYLLGLVAKGRFEQDAGAALARMPAGVVVPVLLRNYDSRRVRRVLVLIAGADHGRELARWKHWWKSHP